MTPWLVQLLTLVGVAIGAIASFFSTRLIERSRWQREEAIRWDTKRLGCYGEFAAVTNRFIQIAIRLAGGLGLPSTGQPLDSVTGLAILAAAEEEIGVKWEQILMLASPDTIRAAREWRFVHGTWNGLRAAFVTTPTSTCELCRKTKRLRNASTQPCVPILPLIMARSPTPLNHPSGLLDVEQHVTGLSNLAIRLDTATSC